MPRLCLAIVLLLLTLLSATPAFSQADTEPLPTRDQLRGTFTEGAIRHILVLPQLDPDGIEVKLWFNAGKQPTTGTQVRISVGERSAEGKIGEPLKLALPGAPRWTPDTPNMLACTVTLGAETHTIPFGLRLLTAQGTKLLLNGEPFYLRGFGCDGNGIGGLQRQVQTPAGYKKYVERAREFGFNTMRSHMPFNARPKEFLDACDEGGLAFWAEFDFNPDQPDLELLAHFWNHPSVVFWCWGNEMHGVANLPTVQKAYPFMHNIDPSRLVMDNSGWGQYDRETTDVISHHMGYFFPYDSRATALASYSIVISEGSMKGETLEQAMERVKNGTFKLTKPLLAHETNNYQAFPDIRARRDRMNFQIRPQLVKKLESDRRSEYLDLWVLGSGKFKAAMDKLAIEQVRKSPILEGFEAWMLADHSQVFSGMMADGEDCLLKPGIDPKDYRVFNAATVLLADFPKNNVQRSFYAGESFNIRPIASVYGAADWAAGPVKWQITHDGIVIVQGSKDFPGVKRGQVLALGDLPIQLPEVKTPAQCLLTMSHGEDEAQVVNSWPIWIYPRLPKVEPTPAPFKTFNTLGEEAFSALGRGESVFITLEKTADTPRTATTTYDTTRTLDGVPSVWARFRPGMWEWGHNLGAAMQPHPALAGFPNAGFSDLQFYHPIDNGRKIILESAPFWPEIIVHAVDMPMMGYTAEIKARRATYLFEIAVGEGKLLVSGFNFSDEAMKYPETQALHDSIMRYLCSDAFAPKTRITLDELKAWVAAPKPDQRYGSEGHWESIFYNDRELPGRDVFMDRGLPTPWVETPLAKP